MLRWQALAGREQTLSRGGEAAERVQGMPGKAALSAKAALFTLDLRVRTLLRVFAPSDAALGSSGS